MATQTTNKIQNTKVYRLGKAFVKEGGKRLPYIVALFLLLIFLQGISTGRKATDNITATNENSVKLKLLTEKNARLTEKVIELQQQAIKQSEENAAHIDCVAEAFAHYTQTGEPVYFKDNDLSACILLKISRPQGLQPTSSSQSQTSQSVGSNPSASGSSNPQQPGSNNNQGGGNGNNNQDDRSNLEKATDAVGGAVCSIPVLGGSRICN